MKSIVTFLVCLLTLGAASSVSAKGVQWNLIESTPIGSWQLREEVETNHKGKQTVNLIRTSMLSMEERDGEPHYWVETSMQTFKLRKNGKRKAKGKPVVMKALMPESLFTSDPSNAMENLQSMGTEVIVQQGKQKPMRIGDTSALMQAASAIAKVEMTYDFSELGKETVEVDAGKFDTKKIAGSADVEVKVLFKKIKANSQSTIWIAKQVPFGTVKMQDETTTNGKVSQTEGRLLEYGMSGATSQITGEIQDAPEMPKLNDLFGG